MTKAPVLSLPDLKKKTVSDTYNALGTGTGVVLIQEGHHISLLAKCFVPNLQIHLHKFVNCMQLLRLFKNGVNISLENNLLCKLTKKV